jgi:hypothetical protein
MLQGLSDPLGAFDGWPDAERTAVFSTLAALCFRSCSRMRLDLTT